jgi:hypothetical protein
MRGMARPRLFELYTPEKKGIIAELDEGGVLTFAIEAGPGSSIRGTEMFNRMMDCFGEDVRVIQAVWRKNPQGLPSTNIDKVNELTAAGMALLEAVHHAWTVTRAVKRGFRKVSLIGAPDGVPGAYTKMDVQIEK